jgi:hypothetical protein
MLAPGRIESFSRRRKGVVMASERSSALRGRLERLVVRCPDCRQVWLAPGLAGGDTYACKACAAVLSKKGGGASRPPRELQRPLPE